MTGLTALWLPILLSAVFVFVVSSIIHMAMPWHKNDYPGVPNEDRVMEALRPFGIPPGDYMMPRPATRKDMGSPEFLEKRKKGPVAIITVMSGDFSMGKTFVQWMLFLLAVGASSAFVAGRALPAGAAYRQVFKFAGAAAFLAHAGALWPMSIWYRRAWSTTFKSTIDAIIYAGVTAGTFGWLWPR